MKYVGIDPAFRSGGTAVAIIDESRTVRVKSYRSFLDLLLWMRSESERGEKLVLCIENSNLQEVTFDNTGSRAAFGRKSRNVGKNQAASQYTYEAAVHYFGEERTFEVSPRQKGKKWSKRTFQGVLKSEKHTLISDETVKQDHMDAYQLALIGKRLFSFAQAGFRGASLNSNGFKKTLH